MNPIDYIYDKFGCDRKAPSPLQIPVRRVPEQVELYRELEYKVGAEIGVDRGLFSAEICKANPGVKLYCIDPWQDYPRYGEIYTTPYAEQCYAEAVARLEPYQCTIIRAPSMEAVKHFDDGALDFVYIDGNHAFEFVVNDIAEWSRKVRVGGMVSGHDYSRPKNRNRWDSQGVIHAVNGYTWAYRIHPWWIMRGSASSGWFWIKTR